jgi:predicted RNA-binding Zn-ribbon protein involved in translation (DUF1610 family)
MGNIVTVAKTSRTQPEDIRSQRGSDGTDGAAVNREVTTDPCPNCGEGNQVRWYDSTPGADMWGCTSCGYEWTVAVEEACTRQLAGGPGE